MEKEAEQWIKLCRTGSGTEKAENGPKPAADGGYQLRQDGAGTPVPVGPQVHLSLLRRAALGGRGAALRGTGQAEPPYSGDRQPAPAEKRGTAPEDFGIGKKKGYMAYFDWPESPPDLADVPAHSRSICCDLGE